MAGETSHLNLAGNKKQPQLLDGIAFDLKITIKLQGWC